MDIKPSKKPGTLPAMNASAIDAASKHLMLALDALEGAVERRREADDDGQSVTEQLHALGTDRSRLAADLDVAAAHAKTLEATNREVARRLDAAIETIRSVLEANDR
jgi:ABC-type transporter Mla subunit MlaD